MRRVSSLLFILVLLSVRHAYADTTYVLQGTLQDGVGTFQGTLVLEPQYQDVGQVRGTITDEAYSFTIPSYLGENLDYGGIFHIDVFSVGQSYDLYLTIPDAVLFGGAGGAFCALSTPCATTVPSYFSDPALMGGGELAFQTLTLSPQVTPEPASLLLLSTGLTAAGAMMRRSRPRPSPSEPVR